MLFDMKDNVKVAGRPTESAGFAESGEANASAIFDSGGNFGFDRALAHQASFAFALGAGVGDHAASALAGRAGAGDAEESLLIANLAPPITGAALNRGFARRSARSVTGFAGFVAADFDLLFHAEERFFEFQVQVFTQISSTLGPTALAASAPEEIAESEKLAEDVSKVLEDGGIETCRGAGCTAHARVSEAVVK